MSSSNTDSMTGFDRFNFDPSILRGIEAAGFAKPRHIQTETIPAAIQGRDILGLAETGSGKTAAFALPLLDRFVRQPAKGPRALVLAPTRELATQIHEEIRVLARFTRITATTIYGGISQHRQVQALRQNPDIIVGCPGRILDLIGQGLLHLNHVETLVIDEADHMFDMGFLPPLRKIIGHLPGKRQNLLFSATMPGEIRGLADALLHQPQVVELIRTGPAETIEHSLVSVREDRKRDLLERMLTADGCHSAIVFTRTKHRARRLAQQLDQAGHRAVGLQGNMSQSQRDRAMEGFRKKRFDVLVATDIAARGIDVPGVSHVINFDVPNTPEAYTHRIGRTGRAELEGQALTFVTSEDAAWLRATERKLGARIPRLTVDGFEAESIDSHDGRDAPHKPLRQPTRQRSATPQRSGDSSRPRGRRGPSAASPPQRRRRG